MTTISVNREEGLATRTCENSIFRPHQSYIYIYHYKKNECMFISTYTREISLSRGPRDNLTTGHRDGYIW